MALLLHHTQVFFSGALHTGSVLVDKGRIQQFLPLAEAEVYRVSHPATEVFDCHAFAPHALLLPGVIDTHVHFREPGLTHKADIESESTAAVFGGVTYVLDMPNVKPTTTTPEALAEKQRLFAEKCKVGYGLWYGITHDNVEQALADYGKPSSPHYADICGFKVFMGSSTGGMLMDNPALLRRLFAGTHRIIGIHSESEAIIRANIARIQQAYEGREVPLALHSEIRSREACLATTREALTLAKETGAHLHVCHVSTAEELAEIREAMRVNPNITMEVCVSHLWFTADDYARLGARIKCNPAIKTWRDREALRAALREGAVCNVATDHAPHLLTEKEGGALRAASGMPSLQYSLPALYELHTQGVLSLADLVGLMAERPAERFALPERGKIAAGYHADLVLLDPDTSTTVDAHDIQSKCQWSPFEGHTFPCQVRATWVGGQLVMQR